MKYHVLVYFHYLFSIVLFLQFSIQKNFSNSNISHIADIQPEGITGYNLSGKGIDIGLWDIGAVRTTHKEIIGKATQIDQSEIIEEHSTHIAGTLVGRGIHNNFIGIAPDANLFSWDWNQDIHELINHATELVVSNHSYSKDNQLSDTNDSEVDTRWGNYSQIARSMDQLIYEHNHIAVVAAGNNHQLENTGIITNDTLIKGYDSLSPIATAKNVITVGAISNVGDENRFTQDHLAEYSSWGPTNDGRIKPDIVTVGESIFSIGAENDNAYSTLSGTSFAAPIVTGTIGLLTQLIHQSIGTFTPDAAIMKCILIHTAKDDEDVLGPDYRFGWGVLDAKSAANLIVSHAKNGNRIIVDSFTGQLNDYMFYSDGTQPVKVTLVWMDPSGTGRVKSSKYINKDLVNDLDLIIIGADGIHYPWSLDPSNPTTPARTDRKNYIDTVEQVSIQTPVPGEYRVIISRTDHINQILSFALCIDGLTNEDRKHELFIAKPLTFQEFSNKLPLQLFINNMSQLKTVSAYINDTLVDELVFDDKTKDLSPWLQFDERIDISHFPLGVYRLKVESIYKNGFRYEKQTTFRIFNGQLFTHLSADESGVIGQLTLEHPSLSYEFSVPTSGYYSLETSPLGKNPYPDTKLILYEYDDNTKIPVRIQTNDDDGIGLLSIITQNFASDKTYRVEVSRSNQEHGYFQLHLSSYERKPLQIAKLAIDQPKQLFIDDPQDSVWYQFSVPKTGYYDFVFKDIEINLSTVDVEIYNEYGGEQIVSKFSIDSDSANTFHSVSLHDQSLYYLKIMAKKSVGFLEFSIHEQPNQRFITTLNDQIDYINQFTYPTESHWYEFTSAKQEDTLFQIYPGSNNSEAKEIFIDVYEWDHSIHAFSQSSLPKTVQVPYKILLKHKDNVTYFIAVKSIVSSDIYEYVLKSRNLETDPIQFTIFRDFAFKNSEDTHSIVVTLQPNIEESMRDLRHVIREIPPRGWQFADEDIQQEYEESGGIAFQFKPEDKFIQYEVIPSIENEPCLTFSSITINTVRMQFFREDEYCDVIFNHPTETSVKNWKFF